jgi:hypothetical protein
MDFQEFDLTPYDEPCAQVGKSGYYKRSKLEYQALTDQLIRMFGNPYDHNVSFSMGSCSHDFGTYHELRVEFQEWNEYLDNLEKGFPKEWDKEALKFLREKGYFENHPEKVRQQSDGNF